METFSLAKEIIPNPNFTKQRQKALENIDYQDIDQPIVNIIKQINALPFCFTLQCCYGHFLHEAQQNEHNLDPIPKSSDIKEIEYRIAYLAICIDGNKNGRELLNKLQELLNIDSQNIQFGGAEWF